jgi:hypothetical protein
LNHHTLATLSEIITVNRKGFTFYLAANKYSRSDPEVGTLVRLKEILMITLEKVTMQQEHQPKNEVSLSDLNFYNTVLYYREELRKIDRGELATNHLKDRQRKSLVKAGVLKRVYGKGGCRLKLSIKARKILFGTENILR